MVNLPGFISGTGAPLYKLSVLLIGARPVEIFAKTPTVSLEKILPLSGTTNSVAADIRNSYTNPFCVSNSTEIVEHPTYNAPLKME